MRNASGSRLAFRNRTVRCEAAIRLVPLLLLVPLLVSLSCDRARESPAITTDEPSSTVAPNIPPPDVGSANAIIAGSAEFSEFEFTDAALSLPLQTSMMNQPALAAANDLAEAGWITITDGTVTLTGKAASDRRFITRPNGFLDLVPLAKKQFVGVSALKPQTDGTLTATFIWQWLPNDLAQAFRRGEIKTRFEGERDATATLMWDGTAWTVLRITKQAE